MFHSDTALFEVVVFPHLPAKVIWKLFSCCFPDLVAFLPDEHKVINMSSGCSDHWAFRSCHHSVCVCVFFSYQGWINQNPTAGVRCQASPAVFLQHCRHADVPLHGCLHQSLCCLVQFHDFFRRYVQGCGQFQCWQYPEISLKFASLWGCSTDVSLGGRQQNPSMFQIAITTVWFFSSWLEMLLVCFHSRDPDIPKSRCEPWETCSRFHQDGTPQPIVSSICFLSVVYRAAPVFSKTSFTV